jgi:hypothetical protein
MKQPVFSKNVSSRMKQQGVWHIQRIFLFINRRLKSRIKSPAYPFGLSDGRLLQQPSQTKTTKQTDKVDVE